MVSRLQVIQDAVDRVCVRGGELVRRRNEIGLDDHVLLRPQRRADLIVDRLQRRGDVLAAVVALHHRNRRPRERRRLTQQRPQGRGKSGELQHGAAGETHRGGPPL
jgi:hypothetical protein